MCRTGEETQINTITFYHLKNTNLMSKSCQRRPEIEWNPWVLELSCKLNLKSFFK